MKRFLVFFSILFFLFTSITPVFAQTISPTIQVTAAPTSSNSAAVESAATMGVAHLVEVKDKNVKDGTILSASDQGGVPSDLAYDPQVLGVVSQDAAIVFNSGGNKTVPVISVGNVYILVSTKFGKIKKGDLLTTSTIPGVAVRAIQSGYVLGTALEDYDNPDPKKIDKIAADLNLHYFNSKPTFPGSLTDILKIALLSTRQDPSPIYKDIVAALVVLGSFVLGFMTFGRAAAKGVEALGRNPAAGRIIHLGIIFNVGIVCVIVLAGLAVAFLILRL